MTASPTAAPREKNMNEKDVIAYLKTHPEFLQKHPELLDHLNLPAADLGKGVADFQKFMVDKLKKDRDEAVDVQNQLISVTRANLDIYDRVQAAVLGALEARSFEEFIEIVTHDFAVIMDVDVVSLVIEANEPGIHNVHLKGVRVVSPGTIKKWLRDGDGLLQGHIRGSEEIFGPAAGLVHSQALIQMQVGSNTPLGIIAFGSRNPDMFHHDQAIDHVGFLAEVVERCIRLWLQIPV
ncbi:MAG: DUF484 family protein [Proteobacteria bacterium]|nr:DUF484 family protein [Pseudomonadota bacterium]